MSLNKVAYSEVELRLVGGVNAPVGSRDPAVPDELLRLMTSDDTVTPVLTKSYQYRSKFT